MEFFFAIETYYRYGDSKRDTATVSGDIMQEFVTKLETSWEAADDYLTELDDSDTPLGLLTDEDTDFIEWYHNQAKDNMTLMLEEYSVGISRLSKQDAIQCLQNALVPFD
jgi:hypothetical protein